MSTSWPHSWKEAEPSSNHYTKASPDAADIGSFPTQADGSLHTTLLPRVSLVIFQEPQHLLALTYVGGEGGDEITVPTIDGKVSYNVPEGTQPGTTFRLRNKGIQYVNNRGRGDQYVRVTIEVPTNLSGKQKDMLRDFDSTTGDKNYAKRKNFFDKIKDAFKGD